jgi:tRNA/tmRNA/rRNA uracil-C5-methylase (TrmA/RlmC/RlmD family)
VRVIARPEAKRGAPPEARETIIENVGRHRFRVDAGGFWQVHRLAADTLFNTVSGILGELQVAPDAVHFDLYGGVGLFATAIAAQAGREVVSVESDGRATAHALENLSPWRGADAVTARVDRWLPRLAADVDATDRARIGRGVVVLDPPRSGAGRDVVAALGDLAPAGIVYVACDPVALARDLRYFADAGYEVSHLNAFDLFPHSHHVETIATLRRTRVAR